jgi:hypothetical protein
MKQQSEGRLMHYYESNLKSDITRRAGAEKGHARARFTLLFILGLLFAVWGPSRAAGQNTGTILGDVTDSTGAVVTQATVKLVSTQEAGWQRTVTTNDHGEFVLPLIPAGDYILTVSKAKFKDEMEPITLDLDAKLPVHVKLTPQGLVTKIEVQGAISGKVEGNDDSGSLGQVLQTRLVNDIPLSDNSVVGVAQTLPGVNDVNAPTSFTTSNSGPTFSTSGSRVANNLFLYDGIMYNNLFRNTGLNFPSQEAIQEVSMLVNNMPAEYGRNSGAVFNVITKSGGNQLHGAAWDYLRNTDFDADNWWNKWAQVLATGSPEGAAKSKDDQNQFGAVLGGPIIKDKLFFFGSYQGYRLKGTLTTSQAIPPSAQELGLAPAGSGLPCSEHFVPAYGTPGASGYLPAKIATTGLTDTLSPEEIALGQTSPCADFSDLAANPQANTKGYSTDHLVDNPNDHYSQIMPLFDQVNQQEAQQLGYSSYVGQTCVVGLQAEDAAVGSLPVNQQQAGYLPGGKMPASCISPVILGLFTGNNPAHKVMLPLNTSAIGATNVITTGDNNKTDDNGFIRFDYNRGKQTFDTRYNIVNADDFVPSTSKGAVTSYGVVKDWARSHFISINDTILVNPNTVDLVRAAYRRYTSWTYPTDNTTAADLGINFPEFDTQYPTLPALSLGSYLSLGSGPQGTGTANFDRTVNKSIELDDSLSWTRGKHLFQFGATYLYLNYLDTNDGNTQGNFHISDNGTGQDLGDFVMGDLNGNKAVYYYTARTSQGAVQNNYYFYAKDDWRIFKRLTLNLGARWELSLPWQEPDQHWGSFIPGEQSTVIPSAPMDMVYPGDPGVAKGIIKMPMNQVMPRLGFSYDLFGDGKTALRGGFGMFYNAINANVVQNNNEPWMNVQEADTFADISNPIGTAYGLNTVVLNPNNPNLSSPNCTNCFAPGIQTMFYLSPYFKPAYAMAYNLGIQQQLPGHVNVEADYVGKLGRHEYVVYESNPALIDYNSSPKIDYNSHREYIGFGDNTTVSSKGASNYNSLQVLGSKRASKRLIFTGSYTWSRSIDLNSQEYLGQLTESARVPYPWDPATERGPSDFNTTHVGNLSYVLDLPGLNTDKGWLKAITNDWTYGGLFAVSSGMPVNITEGGDENGTGTQQQRPMLIGDWQLPSNRAEVDKVMEWFNGLETAPYYCGSVLSMTQNSNNTCTLNQPSEWVPGYYITPCPQGNTGGTEGINGYNVKSPCPGGAFEKAAYGTWGNVGRNSVVGPGKITNNMYISKKFKIPHREGMTLEYRCEALGVFNHPQFGQPSGAAASDGSFGKIVTSKGERNLQMNLKLRW